MTLTEEQRAALKRVAAYMDDMYAIASPYHGCTEDSDLLRAMIDSSDHIVEPDELIGFDLERARGLRDFLQDDCAEVGDVWGEMIAEIERLRAENEDLSKAVIDIQEERDLAQAEFRSYHRAWEEQAARVQELEGMLSIRTEELDIAHSVARSEKEMHEKELAAFARRIKELEEVLVEMVATNPCNIPTLCDVVHDELMCPALDGNCDFWKGCPQKNELREAARKQLQAEGKIGSGGGA